jgi:hypothetical protein
MTNSPRQANRKTAKAKGPSNPSIKRINHRIMLGF